MRDENRCVKCRANRVPEQGEAEYPTVVCLACAPWLPDALLKACVDPFDYALQVRSGDVIRFEQARISGSWVFLSGIKEWNHVEPRYPAYTFDRGVDVRIEDIVWVCDAPQGS